jgi:hypothetical protein
MLDARTEIATRIYCAFVAGEAVMLAPLLAGPDGTDCAKTLEADAETARKQRVAGAVETADALLAALGGSPEDRQRQADVRALEAERLKDGRG